MSRALSLSSWCFSDPKLIKLFTGISFKTQLLYVVVFVARYLDLFFGEWVSLYNTLMKLFFIGSSGYILYLMQFKYR